MLKIEGREQGQKQEDHLAGNCNNRGERCWRLRSQGQRQKTGETAGVQIHFENSRISWPVGSTPEKRKGVKDDNTVSGRALARIGAFPTPHKTPGRSPYSPRLWGGGAEERLHYLSSFAPKHHTHVFFKAERTNVFQFSLKKQRVYFQNS